MELAQIIEGLNQKENLTMNNLDEAGLTEVEKNFFTTYQPQKALVIYGTLAPGKPNHHVVEHIKGDWKQGTVRGQLKSEGWGAVMGYNGFVPTPIDAQDRIEAFILVSEQLVENWQMLDDFEGEGYKRILVKYELKDGDTGIGYIYAINQ